MLKIKYFEFNPICVNTYVIYNESKQCIIVDAGNYNSVEDHILFEYIDYNQLKPIMILNTHGHIDHILGNAAVANKYHISLASHPDGRIYYDKVWMYAGAFGLNYDKESTIYPSIDLYDNQIINIGEDKLKVIFTPGHAKGSCCFYDEADGFVLTGDTLFYRSIGRTDLPGGSYKELVASIKNKLYRLPKNTICYCGHGPATIIGDEKRCNSEVTDF